MADKTVMIKGNSSGLTVNLDESADFAAIKEAAAKKFHDSAKFLGTASMAVEFTGRPLSEEETAEMLDVISSNCDINVVYISDNTKKELFKNAMAKAEGAEEGSPALENSSDKALDAQSAAANGGVGVTNGYANGVNSAAIDNASNVSGEVKADNEDRPGVSCDAVINASDDEPYRLANEQLAVVTKGAGADKEPAEMYVGNIRSGQTLKFKGSATIIGNVNPGGEVIAVGNVVVLGSLKGMVTAGAMGDTKCFVVSTNLDPMQVRIGNVIARSPDQPKKKSRFKKEDKEMKIAYVLNTNICIDTYSAELISEIYS
jgi:septum site-determining protein MinC